MTKHTMQLKANITRTSDAFHLYENEIFKNWSSLRCRDVYTFSKQIKRLELFDMLDKYWANIPAELS